MAKFFLEGVFSYPKLFKAVLGKDSKPGDMKAWSVAVLFTEEDTQTPRYKAAVAEAERVGRIKFGDKFDALMKDGKLKWPFRKDVESAGYPKEYVRFVNVRKVQYEDTIPPQVVGRDLQPITDPAVVFPGVRGLVSINIKAFDNAGNRGVRLELCNAQYISKGKRLDTHVDAKDEFDQLPAEETADDVASMLG